MLISMTVAQQTGYFLVLVCSMVITWTYRKENAELRKELHKKSQRED